MTPRLVIFDVDGTLVDSQADIVASMEAAFDAVGRPALPREELLSIVGLSLPLAMQTLVPDADQPTLDAMEAAYRGRYFERRTTNGTVKSSPLYPHVRGVLDALHAEPETLLAIATGKSRRGLLKLVEGHGLERHFVALECADDHPSKPHPSMLEAAMSAAGVEPNRAVMVGDTSFDMEMARAAGLFAVGVSWGYHDRARLRDAHVVIDDIRQLPGLLEQVWRQSA